MEFFTQTDFDQFAQLRKQKIIKGTSESDNTGNLLKASIYAKTNYWAEGLVDRLAKEGFEMKMSWRWQNSSTVRSYSWAMLYRREDKDSRVFFTVGVGSRFTTNKERVHSLEYKLDCLRKNKNSLSSNQVDDFDRYLRHEAPGAVRRMIDADLLNQYNWKNLFDETYSFIKEYLPHYEKVKSIVWPHRGRVSPKIARLCWNDNKWQSPSGEHGKRNEYPTVHENKFGYEEWLFDTEKQLDGYHYAYIPAFHGEEHVNNRYNLVFYSVFHAPNGKNHFYWIGTIKELVVLNVDERLRAFERYKEYGWLRDMSEQLGEIGLASLNVDLLDGGSLFNVKYQVTDDNCILLQNPLAVEDPPLEITKSNSYELLSILDYRNILDQLSGEYVFREGHNPAQTGDVSIELPKRKIIRSLTHKKIQENIYSQLSTELSGSGLKVSTENPTGFGTAIDLVVSCPKNGDTFYEIKTNESALQCIRAALGQLFEYSFFPNRRNATKLVIVGPYPVVPNIEQYMKHLRDIFNVPLYYQYYSYEKEELEDGLF